MNFLVGYGEVNMILLICKELDLSNIRSDIIVYPTFLNIYYLLESIITNQFQGGNVYVSKRRNHVLHP